MQEEAKSSKNSLNTVNDGKVTKPNEKVDRNKLAATAADKLDDYEWRSYLIECGLQKCSGRRSSGSVIRLKKEKKEDDEEKKEDDNEKKEDDNENDKNDDSFIENDSSLD